MEIRIRVTTRKGRKVLRLADAQYVCHVRTLTGSSNVGGRSYDIDLFRLADGREVLCRSSTCDGRDTPTEVRMTVDEAMFAEY